MSSFALQAGLAMALVIAAVVAAVILHRHGSRRRSRGQSGSDGRIRYSSWEHGDDLQHSIEAVEAKAAEAAKLGENVLAAVKPIELALKDLNKRVGELHARVDVSDKLLAKLTFSSRGKEQTPEEEARAAAADEARLEALEQQLTAPANPGSIEGAAVQDGESATVGTVEARLADLQSQMESLIRRVDLVAKGRPSLSLVASLANLVASSEKIPQRVAGLEQHLPSELKVLEAQVDAAPSSGEITPPVVSDETVAERIDDEGDAQDSRHEVVANGNGKTPWMLKSKERTRLRRRCMACGQTKLLLPKERICDDCGLLPAAERGRQRNLRKTKAGTAATPGGPRPRGKRR